MSYYIEKAIKANELLRKSFNTLAKETFSLDFEDWYQNGYWKDNYIPYSLVIDNQVIANASANPMTFIEQGIEKHYVQIGTVMTHKDHQKKGYSRILIEEIIKDYTNEVDGFFLFANDSVLNFYPKFGFRKGCEYQCSKSVQNQSKKSIRNISMKKKEDWIILENAIKESICHSRFDMKCNVGLIMFYVTKFMRENVYYLEKENAYVIAEQDDSKLLIYHIFSPTPCSIDPIIESFGPEIHEVTLGFTPLNTDGFTISKVNEEDSTLFLLGDDFSNFEKKEIMFPLLGHA